LLFVERKKMKPRILLCGLALVAPLGVQANLITNGDFSLGNTGFTTSYTYFAGTGNATYGAPPVSNGNTGGTDLWDEGVYTITNSQPMAWHSLWRNNVDLTDHGYYMLFNGSTASGGSTAWSQTIAPPLVDGQTYRLSFDLVTVYGSDLSPANLNIKIGSASIGSVTAPTGIQQWSNVFLEFTYDSSWGSSANILNIQTASTGNDFGIDNLSLTPVPEPFTMALGAMGVAAFLRKRIGKKS